LSVVPLFVLMGELASATGMSCPPVSAGTKSIFGTLRGSLAYATIGANAGFGAVCGSSVASAATMTRICVPEMRREKYDDRLSTGSVAAGGTLGILIPPSLIFVIYAVISQQSVAKLFAAGLIPGIVLTALHCSGSRGGQALSALGSTRHERTHGATSAQYRRNVGVCFAVCGVRGRHLCRALQSDRSRRRRCLYGLRTGCRAAQIYPSFAGEMLYRDDQDHLHAVHDHHLRDDLFLFRGPGTAAGGPDRLDQVGWHVAARA
jgi:hypothetical protein